MSLAADDEGQAGGRYNLSASEWVRMPRQARSEETLVRFLDATADLLSERPFDEISVNDIVEHAGRTVGSFYARFGDKSGVLRFLVEQIGGRLRNDAYEYWSVDKWRGKSLDEIVTATVNSVLGAYREAGPVFHAAAIQAPGDEGFRSERLGVWVVCADRFGEVLADHADELGHPDPLRAGRLAMTAMIAMADVRLIYGPEVRPCYGSDEALAADLVEMVHAIIGSRV